MSTVLNCPTCKKEIQWSDDFPDRPFCSERCKLIDLGEWADESHKIKGPTLPIDPKLIESGLIDPKLLEDDLSDPDFLDSTMSQNDSDSFFNN